MGWEGQRAGTLGITVSSPCASSAQAVRASGSPTDRAPGWVESGGDEVEDAEGLGTILIPVTTGPMDNMATRVRGIVCPLPDAPTSFLYSCCYFSGSKLHVSYLGPCTCPQGHLAARSIPQSSPYSAARRSFLQHDLTLSSPHLKPSVLPSTHRSFVVRPCPPAAPVRPVSLSILCSGHTELWFSFVFSCSSSHRWDCAVPWQLYSKTGFQCVCLSRKASPPLFPRLA